MKTIKEKIELRISEALNLDAPIYLERARFGEADFTLTPKEIAKVCELSGLARESLLGVIQENFAQSDFQEITLDNANGFINVTVDSNSKLFKDEIIAIVNTRDYLLLGDTEDSTIIVDYSGPNVAKRFSVGNLRSTVIGSAVAGAYNALGFKVEGWNHLGDWGTQFGKLIVAIKRWGNIEEIEADPIVHLTDLYVEFHAKAKENPELEEEARSEFRKLELQDPEAVQIWKDCVRWSMKEFDHYYELLNVKIENTVGESFYTDRTQDIVKELDERGLLKESEGAKIVDFDDLPPAIIQKKDEAALYLTRDLASIKYRIAKYNPKKIIYHVGLDQHLHFQQLFRIAELLGWTDGLDLVYAGHGMVSLPNGKMSTREGNVVLLEDLIDESRRKVSGIFKDKTDSPIDEAKVNQIAISAIKYSDLRQNRKTNIVFSLDQAVSLNGNSGPYLQYTVARINSVIKKSGLSGDEVLDALDSLDINKEYLKPIFYFKDSVVESAMLEMPNLLCNFAFDLATIANGYYEKVRIIDEDQDAMVAKILPLVVYKKILEKSFEILGLSVLESI